MTILFEIGGAFWWLPQYRRAGFVRRIFWLWFGVAWFPQNFGSFLNAVVKVAREVRHER